MQNYLPGPNKLKCWTVGLLAATVLIALLTYAGSRSGLFEDIARRIFGRSSRILTPAEAARAEKVLAWNPDDLVRRSSLIMYYEMQFSLSHRQEFEEKREQHVLWLIAHHPDSEGAALPSAWLAPDQPRYAEAKALWLQQAKSQSGNVSVLANAASALQFEAELSRELASRALAMKPKDRRLRELIARSYMREMRCANSAEQRKSSARSALQALEAAAEVQPDAPPAGDLLQDLAVSAFESGDWKKAKAYANALVAPQKRGVEPDGDAIHIGNTLLGSLALQDGDIEEAKRRLIASAPEEGSPILDSYGPRMSLAAALLDRGERSTVIAYLDKSEHFWRLGLDKIPHWEAEIRADKTPDFGENLRW